MSSLALPSVSGRSTAPRSLAPCRGGSFRLASAVLDEAPSPKRDASEPVAPAVSVSWIEQQLAEEQLSSTPQQRLIVAGSFGLNFWVLGRAMMDLSSWEQTSAIVLAAAAGYLVADLLSGVYHWSIDNYGSKETPIFGNQIEGFQRHHRYPWTITYRQFCNNVHTVCLPAIPFSTSVLWLNPPAAVATFCAVGCMMVVLSQQFHSWAHTKKKDQPHWVQQLQRMGLLVSAKMHCQHHRSPFDIDYCIVSGIWNPLLDRYRVFYALERIIYDVTDVPPRSWTEHSAPAEDIKYFGD